MGLVKMRLIKNYFRADDIPSEFIFENVKIELAHCLVCCFWRSLSLASSPPSDIKEFDLWREWTNRFMEVRTFYDEGAQTLSIRRHGSTPERDKLGLPVDVVDWVNLYWQKFQLEHTQAEIDYLQDKIENLELAIGATAAALPASSWVFPSMSLDPPTIHHDEH